LDQRASTVRRESDVHLGRRVPGGSLPLEHDARGRAVGLDEADDELLSVGEAFEEAAAFLALEIDLIGARAAERVAVLQRPPASDVLREHAEGRFDRTVHVNRLPDGHLVSSCSANALNACNASSHSLLTRSTYARTWPSPGDAGVSRYRTSRPWGVAVTRPACRSTRRCFDTAGREMDSPRQRSPARYGCRPMRSSSMRRVGSASAANVRSSAALERRPDVLRDA